jgi:hypothetical protein
MPAFPGRTTERETLASLRSHQVTTPFVTGRSVCCTHGSSCRQLPQECNDLTRSLCSSSITEPSSLLRIGPPQCFASVLSPHGFHHLCFSLGIEATGSCSSAKKPASDSRPLHAGRRPPSHQAPDRLIPEGPYAPGFDDIWIFNDASSMGLLSFVSRTHTCSRYFLELWLQRSPPWLFTTAAWSGLRPAPESRSRGAFPHLFRSFTTWLSVARTSFPIVSAAHYSQNTELKLRPL